MGHKIFISYKYHDESVYQQIEHYLFEEKEERAKLTPRDYVNVLAEYISNYSPHYCKAEDDNNDLSALSEEQIWEILKDKMFDSTLTIVLVSPCMREANKKDRDQWIPWEIKYSLDKNTRHDSSGNAKTSNTNAMLAIVLPDYNGKYDYYFEYKRCCASGCRLNKINTLFYILKENTFNQKKITESYKCKLGDIIYKDNYHSYIPFYRWCDINSKEKIEAVIEHCYDIQSKKEQYDICHEID